MATEAMSRVACCGALQDRGSTLGGLIAQIVPVDPDLEQAPVAGPVPV